MDARWKKRTTRSAAIAVLAMACSVVMAGAATSVASAAPGRAPMTAAKSFANYKNNLSGNTKGWCTPAQGCNGQGGNSAFYGTIDIVPSSYSNYGGYAASVPGPGGKKHYARTSGAGLLQDTFTGCPTPGYDAALNTPYCEGPYVCYGGTCAQSVFPTNGFTSSIKIYIDPVWAAANPGQNLDWDVGLNNTFGNYLNDNGFTMCTTSAGGGGFYLSLNQFSSCSPTSQELTAAGWYTFTQVFQPVAGSVVVTYSVTPPTGPVWTSVVNTGLATSATGGPSYGWLADEDILGLPVSQISMKKN